MSAIVEVNGLNRSFGGLHAVCDVSFAVEKGIIKAVIGPNGAGKTTLFNLISGATSSDSGTVIFNGRQIQNLRPCQVAAQGVARTFQHTKLFPKMTALENVMVGRHVRSTSGFWAGMLHLPRMLSEEKSLRRRALEIMEFVGISDYAQTEATSLAFGQQRLLELARALAAEPEVLLLDEPAAGLNMNETEGLAQLILRIKALGVTILLVEHDMSLVMGISDEIVVLSSGRKIADGVPQSVQSNREVISVYLGEDDA